MLFSFCAGGPALSRLSASRLVGREIAYRPLGSLLGVAGVAVATILAVAIVGLTGHHSRDSGARMIAKEQATRDHMRAMHEDYQRIDKAMGYDASLLPADADVVRARAGGFAGETAPEALADSAAALPGITHVLPRVGALVSWPEHTREVLVVGIGAERSHDTDSASAPYTRPLPGGFVRVGFSLAGDLDLSAGQQLTFGGKRYTIDECHGEMGDWDDVSLWFSLADAQRILEKQGRISDMRIRVGRQADSVRVRVAEKLPQLRLHAQSISLRTGARLIDTARVIQRDMLAMEHADHGRLTAERRLALAALLTLVALGCAAWVAVVSYVNARQRRAEIGILQTVGVPAGLVLRVLAAKAIIISAAGALTGLAAGLILVGATGGAVSAAAAPAAAVSAVLAVLSIAAFILPATVTVRRNPATVLWQTP